MGVPLKITRRARPAPLEPSADVEPISCSPPNEHASFSFPHGPRPCPGPQHPSCGCAVVRGGGPARAGDGRRLRRGGQRQQRDLVESGGPGQPGRSWIWRLPESVERPTPGCQPSRTGLWSFSLATPPLGVSYYRLKVTDIRANAPTEPADGGREDRAAGVGTPVAVRQPVRGHRPPHDHDRRERGRNREIPAGDATRARTGRGR